MPSYQMKPSPIDAAAAARLNAEQNQLLDRLEVVENNQRDSNGGFRKEKKELKARSKEIRQELKGGTFRARIECTEVPDDTNGVMVINDIKGQRLDTRPMSKDEKTASKERKQGSLDFNGKGKSNGKANGKSASATLADAVDGIRNPGGGMKLVSHGFEGKGKSNGAAKANGKHEDPPVKVGKRDATPAGDTAVSIKGQPLVNRKKALKAKGKVKSKGSRA